MEKWPPGEHGGPGSFGEWLTIIQDTEVGTETRTHVSSNESLPEAFWELPSIPWSLPQGPSPPSSIWTMN